MARRRDHTTSSSTSSRSTPGSRALLYLQRHRDSRYTNLPPAQRKAYEQLLANLRATDPTVADRALYGSNKHFSRPLTGPEREYQRHLRAEHRLDERDVQEGRRRLDEKSETPASRAAGGVGTRRPSRTPRHPLRAGRRAADAAAVGPVRDAAGMAWTFVMLTIALSGLYLLVSRPRAAIALINTLGGAFTRLASTQPLFGAAKMPSSLAAALSAPPPPSLLSAAAANRARATATLHPRVGPAPGISSSPIPSFAP